VIYSKKIRNAYIICFNAHKDDYDKAGYPYAFHPFFLASQMDEKTQRLLRFYTMLRKITAINMI